MCNIGGKIGAKGVECLVMTVFRGFLEKILILFFGYSFSRISGKNLDSFLWLVS